MTKTELANKLAYVAITGAQRFLTGKTRVALIGFTSLSRELGRLYDVNEKGMELVRKSKTWAAHECLVAEGFKVRSDRKATQNYIPYIDTRHLVYTKSGCGFVRSAFIGTGGSVYMDIPDDSTGSGWRMSKV